jgi:hypothetical protein
MNRLAFQNLKKWMIVKVVKIDEDPQSDIYKELEPFLNKKFVIEKVDRDEEYVTLKGKDFYISEIELIEAEQIKIHHFKDTFNPEEIVT